MFDLADDLAGTRANFGRGTLQRGTNRRQRGFSEFRQLVLRLAAYLERIVIQLADQLVDRRCIRLRCWLIGTGDRWMADGRECDTEKQVSHRGLHVSLVSPNP